MERPLWVRWLRVWAVGGAIIGSGLLLFKYTTPTDEELINALSPELREQYEKQKVLRREEQRQLMDLVKKTSQSNDPIWKTGPFNAPWEGKQNTEEVFNKIQRNEAETRQREDLQRVMAELDMLRQKSELRTQEIVNEKKKHWWKIW
ncbi:similar to Saccharomyces cerevisiae YGR174C CBP4 Mitochondrial protein required for assembly of cytochrome bc1 complex [Maudiozyma saulgeensis]|uniref:Cytochrome b mRNA-processing protein 4 n=1 Tax=Maudiozyma saulgeensis TaxID=1789683 RepID=A0A1X7R680_9SACH|nr:similar to Saccharomyces cerevisiae YGR174C CBP4 Mitochondrial protein required for assembly of cytochrome bc1 complex [Kazachstania saulgeensis]